MSSALHSTPGNRGTTGTTSPLCPWDVPLGGRRRQLAAQVEGVAVASVARVIESERILAAVIAGRGHELGAQVEGVAVVIEIAGLHFEGVSATLAQGRRRWPLRAGSGDRAHELGARACASSPVRILAGRAGRELGARIAAVPGRGPW